MLALETLKLDDIERVVNARSLDRAIGYIERVSDAVRNGGVLTARVHGSQTYGVQIEVGRGIIAQCSCPYDRDGYCKHVGAVLLKWIESPASFISVGDTGGVGRVREPMPTYRPAEYPAWLSESVGTVSARDNNWLASGLRDITVADLRSIARERGWSIKASRKDDLISRLVPRLVDPAEISKCLSGLDSDCRHVFRALVLSGDYVALEQVIRLTNLWSEAISVSRVTDCIWHLCDLGLCLREIIDGYGEARAYYYGLGFVPRMIARHVPAILGDVIPSRDEVLPERGEVRVADPAGLLRSVHQVMATFELNPVALRPLRFQPDLDVYTGDTDGWEYDPDELQAMVELGRSGRRAQSDLRVLAPAWHLRAETIELLAPLTGGEARLEFVYAHLVASGVFQPGSPVTVWPEVKQEFLSRTAAAQRAVLARTYFGNAEWSELWEMLRSDGDLEVRRALKFRLTRSQFQTALRRLRQIVLTVLGLLPNDRWITMSDLQPLMRAVLPPFNSAPFDTNVYRPLAGSYSWYLGRKGRTEPLLFDNEEDWLRGGWSFVHHVIGGPLYWLGLVDLCTEGAEIRAIRLHDLGDLFWERTDVLSYGDDQVAQAVPRVGDEVIRFEKHSISVDPTAVSPEVFMLFNRIARLEEVTPQRFSYRLDVRLVHATFEAGETIEDIVSAWDALLSVPMSAEIREQLVLWWEGYGQVRMYEDVSMIEFGDDYALAEMKAITSLEKYLIAEISPRLVLISPEAAETLMAELEKAGHTPRLG